MPHFPDRPAQNTEVTPIMPIASQSEAVSEHEPDGDRGSVPTPAGAPVPGS